MTSVLQKTRAFNGTIVRLVTRMVMVMVVIALALSGQMGR